MVEHSVRRRRLLIGASVMGAFVIGLLAGALVTAAAASRATQVALHGARGLFVYDQTQHLAAAWNAGDMSAALAHAQCAYEGEFADGARWFDTSATGFSVWGGAFIKAVVVGPNAASAEKVRPVGEGLARGKIAVVLERLGRVQEAQEQLAQAAKIGGREPAWWRGIALKTVGMAQPEGGPGGVVPR